jgi:hypothetical protein
MKDDRSEMQDYHSEIVDDRLEIIHDHSEIIDDRSEMQDYRSEMVDDRLEMQDYHSDEVDDHQNEVDDCFSTVCHEVRKARRGKGEGIGKSTDDGRRSWTIDS